MSMIDYSTKTKRFLINDHKPVTMGTARRILRAVGLNHDEATTLLRSCRSIAEIVARHPGLDGLPPGDPLPPAAAAEILASMSRLVRWCRLEASKNQRGRSLRALKRAYSSDVGVPVKQRDLVEALEQASWQIGTDGRAYPPET